MAWGVSGLSARARAPSKGTCCGDSQTYPLAPGHLPKEHAAVSLRVIRSRQRNFRRDIFWAALGLSDRARSSSKGTCCGEFQDYLFARGYLLKGNAAVSLRTIRSRQRAFHRDMLRGVSGLSARGSLPPKVTCCAEFQNYPLARGRFPKGNAAASLKNIR